MQRTIVVAQANTPPGSNGNSQVITVNKPQGEQSITVHLNGSAKLDLSAIANEPITLVHLGDRLIILFDNHAQVTVEPFFGDNGQPLTDVTVELGPGRDVSAADFAGLFPVTTDPSVLPASGGPGSPSAGANFAAFTIDSLGPPGTPLALLGPEGATGGFGPTTGLDHTQIVPMSLTGATITGAANEGGLIIDTIHTVGNTPGAPVVASGVAGSLDALVNFGTGGPSGTPFRFVATILADQWLAHLGLTSNGAPIDTATINGNTLVASTDPAQGAPHDVFSLTINNDGSWTFTLLAPLDDAAGHGKNTATIDLSGLIQAVDYAGVTITLANDFKIVVTDDVPVLTAATQAVGVEEAALAGLSAPGDLFGAGNDPTHAHGLATVTGSLASLVAFGADGPAAITVQQGANHQTVADGFQFTVATGAHDFGISSHGDAVDFLTVTQAGAVGTLTAWTDGGAGHQVFTLTLDGDGAYTFTLINPIDQSGDDTTAMTLDLSSLIKAVDFDGDAVALARDFTVTVANDMPELTGQTAGGAVDEGALAATAGDRFGDGNDHAVHTAVAVVTGSLAGLVSFGADGQALTTGGLKHGFQFTVTDGTVSSALLPGITSHGEVITFYTVATSADGSSQTLTAWAGGSASDGGHEVFTLQLDGDGSYVFTLINPLDEAAPGEDTTTLDFSALIKGMDYDGDAVHFVPGDFTITVTDDVPVLDTTAAVTVAVDEGGLTAATDTHGSGNDPALSASAGSAIYGSLLPLVHFGADGAAGDGTAGFRFVDAPTAGTFLAGQGLTSHGSLIDAVSIDPNTHTLTALDQNGDHVFTLTLNGDGSWTFDLLEPIDHPPGNGENAATIDLSGLVQAVDFDGDTVTLSNDFKVTVTDDVPVLAAGASVTATVDEGGLTTTTNVHGDGNDAGAATSATSTLAGSLATLVSFGADGPGAFPITGGGFQINSDAFQDLGFLQAQGLASHGAAVGAVNVLLSPTGTSELEAFDTNGHAMFDLVVDSDGSWTFNLLEALDEPGPGEDTTQIDLSGLIKAIDFDGDSITLSNDFKITVTDDVPVLTGAASGSVDEAGLSGATDPFGSGNDAGSPSFPVTATGTLGIHIGADGPAVPTVTRTDATIDFDNLSNLGLVVNHGGQIGDFTFTFSGPTGREAIDDNGIRGFITDNIITVTGNAGPFVLTSLDLGAISDTGSNADIVLTGYDALGNAVASTMLSVPSVGTLYPVATTLVFDAAGTAFDGVQIAKLVIADQDTSAGAAVSVEKVGMVTETLTAPLYFTDQATAGNNLTVTDANGHAIGVTELTSHGEQLHFKLLDAETLVAYTGDTVPTAIDGANVVFSVTLSTAAPNGSYDFVLDKPLDQPLTGADALKLAFSYTVNDFDGDTATGTFTVTTTDDVPLLTGATSGGVDEAGLTGATDPYGIGSHPGDANAPTAATGTLGLHFGADGPSVQGSTSATAGIHSSIDLDSFNFHNVGNIDFSGVTQAEYSSITGLGSFLGQNVTVTDALGPFTLTSVDLALFSAASSTGSVELIGLDALGDIVASATVSLNATSDVFGAASYEFDAAATAFAGAQIATLELVGTSSDPNARILFNDLTVATSSGTSPLHFTDQTTAANNVTVTDANGHAVALTNLTSHGEALHFTLLNPETLVAFTGTDATDPVFTVTLSTSAPNGTYDFVLDQPLDELPGSGGALNLTFNYTAQDFDGDTASGSFTVTDSDDVPALATNGSGFTGTVNEAMLPDGTHLGPASTTTGTAIGALDTLVHFGADGPNATPFQFVANASTVLAHLGITSHGASVDFAAISTTATGTTLAAYAGGSANGTEVFTLTLDDTGAWTFTLLAPIDHLGSETLDLSSLVQAVDFDGGGVTLPASAIAVTVLDDFPFAHQVSAMIAETAGPTIIGPTPGVDYAFGADGPGAGGGFSFTNFLLPISAPSGEFFGTPMLEAVNGQLQITPGTTFQELGAGESATFDIPYTVFDFDGDGSNTTSHIILTVTGVNEDPVLGTGVTSGTIDEQTLVTGVATHDTATGTISFTDVDFHDTHTVSTSLVSATWSGAAANGLSIPQQTLTDLATALSAVLTTDSTAEATGTVAWTASIADQDLDFLAQGETLTATYNVTVSDNHGGSATEPVTVTFHGANDEPVVTGGTSSQLTEDIVAQTDLISNGGFENGTAGWVGAGEEFGATTHDPPHSGASDGFLGAQLSGTTVLSSSFTQTTQTVAGQTYQLSFWANSSDPATLEVDWNGTAAASFALPASRLGDYQEYFVLLTGNGNPENLSFVYTMSANGPINSTAFLDDVSLQPLLGATPTTQATSGTVTFSDADVNDTHTATFVVENNGEHTDGTPYVGTFTLDPIMESGGSGTIPWQFTVDRSDIQYLAAGQVLQQFYDVTIADGHGGTVTQRVEVDITGTEDAPVIAAADKSESGAFNAGGGGTDVASGVIHFTDVDLTDRPTGSAAFTFLSYIGADGQNLTLTLTSAELNAIASAFTISQEAGNTNNGAIDWSFSLSDSELAFLTHGQTVTLTETITVDDHHGGTDTSTVTLTLNGPNHAPVITSAPETVTIIDGQSLQPPPNLVANGGFENGIGGGWSYSNFFYPPGLGTAAHSGSYAVGVATYPAANLGTMSQTITDQAGAHYQIELWAIPAGGSFNNTLEIQWNGTTVEAWANVPSISGFNPSNSSQYVEYTADVTGTGSDLLGIVLGTGYYWYVDDVSVTQAVTPGTEQQAGAITFTDADAGDTHTVSYVADGQNYLGTFTAALAADSTGGHTGAVDWSFSVSDSALASLAAQQTVVQTYTVSIDDHHGGVTQQTVTVDLFNPDHAPVIVAGQTSASITSNLDATASTANLIQDGGFEATGRNGHNGLGTVWTEVLQPGDIQELQTDPVFDGKQMITLWTGSDAPTDIIKLSQAVAGTVAGVSYTLTFALENANTFSADSFINVLWNNQIVLTLDPIQMTGTQYGSYTEYSVNVVGTGTTSPLEFDVHDIYNIELDDVSLVATNVAPGVEQTAGTIAFTDADVGDTHTITVTPLGNGYVGTFTTQLATESSGGSTGIVNWNYSVGDAAIAGLALTQTYEITIADGHGGVTTEDVTININDHAPTITSGAQTGSVTEDAHTPIETATGALTFTDPDTSDTHSVMVAPAANGYVGTLTAVEVADSTGGNTGTVDWTYSVDDAAIQSLAAGQSVTQTYTVTVNDGHGGTTSEDVTVTLHGTNDAPVLDTSDTVVLNQTAVPASLLTNPGFESSLSGWSANGSITTATSSHHSGTHSAESTGTGQGTLSQQITTVAGELYTISFWVAASSTSGGAFTASWNGTQLIALSGSQLTSGYQQETFTVLGDGSTDTLAFTLQDNSSSRHVFLDDVTMAPAATLVSSLVGIGSGPNNVTDVDSGATTGIAITGTGGVSGTWFYSTNGGTTWTAFPAVSAANALLLAADSQTEVYFVPATAGAAGTATLTFNAWDQTTGTNGGTANVTVNGGTTAFSTGAETASLSVGTPTAGNVATLTTGADSVFFVNGTHAITATDATLQTTDSLVGGSGSDTLNLTVGSGSGYSFDFGAMAAFVGIDTVALAANPGQSVSLTFTNADIASGQTITVNGSANSSQPFSVDASSVTDGGNFKFVVSASEFAAGPTLAGSLGTDTIQIAGAAALTDLAFAHITGIEVLQLANTADSVTLGADAAAAFGGAGHTLTIDDTAGGNLTLDASAMTGNAPDLLVELTSGNFTSGDHITGGAGIDTVQITDTASFAVDDSDFTNVHGVEVLKIGGTGTDTLNLGALASAAVGGAGHTLTIDDTAGTGPLGIAQSGTGTTANLLIELSSAHFSSADVITGGSGADTIQLVDQAGVVVADSDFTYITSIETLKIGGAADDSVTLGANASHDVGGLGHLFTLDDSAGLGNLYLDAAAMTADLKVLAGAGNDVVVGGAGNDTFFAGLGNDIFTGGLGNNTYVFNSLNLGADQITDFNDTTRADQIQVSAAGFGGGLTQNEDVTSIFQTANNANFSGAGGGQGQFLFDTANHTLYYSANGTTGAEHAIAQIEAGVTVTPHDIHVVA